MEDSIAIKNFITKVRLARSSNAKDLRLTMEEAQDLVSWIAMINANQESIETIQKLNQKMDRILNMILSKEEKDLTVPKINGGGFKKED